MRNFKPFICAAILCIVVFSGCQKEATTSSLNSADKQGKSSTVNTVVLKAKLEKMLASLPAGYEKRLQENQNRFLKLHPEYRALVQRAIVPTICNDYTPIYQWLDGQLADWNNEVFFYAALTGMFDFPTYDAYFFENSSANQYFGVNGEYTQKTTKSFKDLQRFWNIPSQGIVLAAMHGSMLRDREKLIRIDQIYWGDSPEVAAFWADFILTVLDLFPQYRNGDHPIFTFNAFATDAFPFPPFGNVVDKIVMGDGIIDGYVGLGFGDVASQAVLAHEFGHHIQFKIGVFITEFTPEETRRTELMADAYSAYYMSHAQGAAMQWKRVRQFLEVFFNIGDCAFTSPGHHGTPLQRLAAADFGYSVANDAQKQGHILTSQEFASLFAAKLPTLVNP